MVWQLDEIELGDLANIGIDLDAEPIDGAEASLVLNPDPSPDGSDRYVLGRASPIVFGEEPPPSPFVGQVYIDSTRRGIDIDGSR